MKTARNILIGAIIAVVLFIVFLLQASDFTYGQERMKPTPIPQNRVFGTPPAWQTNKGLRLKGFATVLNDSYTVYDITKRVNKSRQKVSIELLDDGSFMVYWPLEQGKKTAYVHLAANFSGLGALVHELIYGDPDAMIAPKALEDQ